MVCVKKKRNLTYLTLFLVIRLLELAGVDQIPEIRRFGGGYGYNFCVEANSVNNDHTGAQEKI